jgi:LPS export ABC transporter protein LptC
MNKKTVIQVLMSIVVILIFLSFYFEYFKKSPKTLKETTSLEKTNVNKKNSSTYIDNINYVSSDTKGNKYQITAEESEIDIDNQDVMFLKNVIAYIFVKDSSTVKITSDYGKYNTKNYDTIFSKNVIVVYPSHKITGKYLDFSFVRNLGTISSNVIYTGDKTKLFADRVEMNITTKDTKIFMNDNTKKVIIKGTK